MDVQEMIDRWHARRIEDSEKFNKHFPASDDLLAIVLRGHLLVEDFLERLNRHCFHFPKYYDQAYLQFSKKLLIARAQVLLPHANPDSFFDGITKLNELRNSLAHNLESPKLNHKITVFLNTIEADYSVELIADHARENRTIEVRLRSAISFILGQMAVLVTDDLKMH
ncbi:MAG: hypothetical protein AB9866_00010 [Syntrophobacteraceae bacterium]